MGQIHGVLLVAANLVVRVLLPLLVVINSAADRLFLLLFKLIIIALVIVVIVAIADILNKKLIVDAPAVRNQTGLKLAKPVSVHVDLLTDLIFFSTLLIIFIFLIPILLLLLLSTRVMMLIVIRLELLLFFVAIFVVFNFELLLPLAEVVQLHLILHLKVIAIPPGLLLLFKFLIVLQFLIVLIGSQEVALTELIAIFLYLATTILSIILMVIILRLLHLLHLFQVVFILSKLFLLQHLLIFIF